MRVRPAALAYAFAFACLALQIHGQVVVNPNQIVGSIRWTNGRGPVRDAIDSRDCWRYRVHAKSIGLPVELDAEVDGFTSACRGRELDRYELTVESSGRGVAYSVQAKIELAETFYRFAPQVSAPVVVEPAPDVTVDFLECGGLFHFDLPPGLADGRVDVWREGEGTFGNSDDRHAWIDLDAGQTSVDLLVRGDDHLYQVRLRVTLGTDPFLDEINYDVIVSRTVACDQVVVVDCTIPPGGGGTGGPGDPGSDLATIEGVFDVVGEREIPLPSSGDRRFGDTMITAWDGPGENARYDDILDDPASGPFELPNLLWSESVSPERPYRVRARSWLRGGSRIEKFETPALDVIVHEGETVDVGDAFVIEPGYVSGGIHLAGPPVSGPFGSVLAHLVPSGSDEPGWEPPNNLNESQLFVTGTHALAPGATHPTFLGQAAVAFPFDFDAVSGDVTGAYDAVLGNIGGDAGYWNADTLMLSMKRRLIPAERHDDIDCLLYAYEGRAQNLLVEPNDHLTIDRDLCLSQVNLSFSAVHGTFFDPRVWGFGRLQGDDYREVDVDEYFTLSASGTPVYQGDAATEGQVTLGLAMGEYTLNPTVKAINPVDGQVSTTEVMPVNVVVGCRQVIDLFPELGVTIGLHDVPACTDTEEIEITGQVHSTENVARIAWSLSGGPSVTVCTNCGISPTFRTSVPLAPSDSAIVVSATDAVGRTATVTAYSRFAREPSALDLRAGSMPLIVEREENGDVTLSWEPTASGSLYRGSIASLHDAHRYDHAGVGACGIVTGTATLPQESGSFYYLAGTACGWGDGSLGRDSFGRERPAALDACR